MFNFTISPILLLKLEMWAVILVCFHILGLILLVWSKENLLTFVPVILRYKILTLFVSGVMCLLVLIRDILQTDRLPSITWIRGGNLIPVADSKSRCT